MVFFSPGHASPKAAVPLPPGSPLPDHPQHCWQGSTVLVFSGRRQMAPRGACPLRGHWQRLPLSSGEVAAPSGSPFPNRIPG